MATNKFLQGKSYAGVKSNGNELVKKLRNKILNQKKYVSSYIVEFCKLFVEIARQNLTSSGYSVTNSMLESITFKTNKNRDGVISSCTIRIKQTKDIAIMYFFEFGTGFVGKEKPHELATEFNWKYAINEDEDYYFDMSIPNPMDQFGNINVPLPTGVNSLGEKVGNKGWVYFNEEKNRYEVTSGLKAVSYFYDTVKYFQNNKEAINQMIKRRLTRNGK